jgi:hypothetical protein
MLPRLRFVVASLVIAVLPMVLLGAGMAPSAHPTSPAELSRADKPVVLGPAEYSETQYRLDRIALSYTRRENELGRLRQLAAAPLANWIAAPAGAASDSTGTVATVTTDGPAVVTVNTTKADKAAEVTVSVTVAPADKVENADKPDNADKAAKADATEKAAASRPAPAAEKPAAAAEPEAVKPAPSKPEAAAPAADSMVDAPKTAVTAPPGQIFAALTPPKAEPPKTETSALPQVHVVAPHAKHKPRARVARKPKSKPARTPPPAAQKPPPFFELFVWLFNIKPDANGRVPAGSASQLQQQQQTHSSVAPTAGFQTASQP